MNLKIRLLLILMLGLTVAACGGNKKGSGAVGAEDGSTVATDDASSQDCFGTGLPCDQLRALGIDGDPLDERVLYFEYNSSNIDQRSRVIAEAHARFLGNNGGARVTLEGHADERGTRDYNLALGERRAKGVADLMDAAGANSAIQTISYGEERPVNPGHDESAWRSNRRVEIKY